MFLGGNIALVRKKWLMKQPAFGELMGSRSKGMISSYERNESLPDLYFMVKLQNYTDINVADFLNRKIQENELPDKPLINNSFDTNQKPQQNITLIVETAVKSIMEKLKDIDNIKSELKKIKNKK